MSVELISDDSLITIENMVGHDISYTITSLGVHRKIMPGISIRVKAQELRALYAEPGGEVMLRNYLRVCDKQMQQEFGIPESQIEYNWTTADIDDVLLNKPEEYLLDALDFAPDGIIEQIKQRAIELELPDNNKRKDIMNRTGVNITKNIENTHVYDNANRMAQDDNRRMRRVNINNENTPQRRVHCG